MPEIADRAERRVPDLSPPPRVLIVAAPYYRAITEHLIAGAEAVLKSAGALVERVGAPGALEIAPTIRLAEESRRYEGYVALGCVIRGETSHYDLVCAESARGLTLLGVERALAVGNGVLTVENEAQALERAEPSRLDKGGDAASACLHLIALARRFRVRAPSFGPEDEQIRLA